MLLKVFCALLMLAKRDSEVKVLIGCTEDEMSIACEHLNGPDFFRAMLVKR